MIDMRDKFRQVCLESPYAANAQHTVETHVTYARRCLADSLSRGEAPLCSHLLYPQVLDDADPKARAFAIEAWLSWQWAADLVAVYCDYGISNGMVQAIQAPAYCGYKPEIEYRRIGMNPEERSKS